MTMKRTTTFLMCIGASIWIATGSALAQTTTADPTPAERPAASFSMGSAPGDPVTLPSGYVIGVGDVLGVKFWQQADLSGDVVVRPDGMISVPLLNDVHAAGQTPLALSEAIRSVAKRWVQEPNVTVIVRQINSRAVYITGRVARAGRYPLNGPTSILQLIAMAGGLAEWADDENVTLMRPGQTGFATFRFNYRDVVERKRLEQNIDLQSGDTVIVP
jgi:polysaccharide export outer membrane protein